MNSKTLNVGFMMPSKKEQQERKDYILNEIKKVKKNIIFTEKQTR